MAATAASASAAAAAAAALRPGARAHAPPAASPARPALGIASRPHLLAVSGPVSVPARPGGLRNSPSRRASVTRCAAMQEPTESFDGGEAPSFGAVFDPGNNFPETPEEWKEKEKARLTKMFEKEGISIRRRPATGPRRHNCGDFHFKIENEGNSPRNILEEIIWHKDVEVGLMKEKTPLAALLKVLKGQEPARDFVGALRKRAAESGQPALIAEVKKASPSRGVIQPDFDPVRIAQAYEAGGAACLSVLTDSRFFQGSFENLKLIRGAGVECPLLCKEFIIDAWQLFYARAHGADAVLLIAAVLPDQDLRYLTKIANNLGLALLIEVHNCREMARVLTLPDVKMIGINNRNLETFKVDINNTVQLLQGEHSRTISERGIMVVGESGLFTPEDIKVVRDAGVGSVLVGESLVKQDDPVAGIKALFGVDVSRTPKSKLEVAAA